MNIAKMRLYSYVLLIAFMLTGLTNSPASASSPQADIAPFETLFTDWVKAFEKKDIDAVCGLFSSKCEASNPGSKLRTYQDIHDGFAKLFAMKNTRYKYRYKVQKVFQSGDLAIVRITWYLTVYKNDKVFSRAEEQGIDIFEKNADGKWQIVNFIAYSEAD